MGGMHDFLSTEVPKIEFDFSFWGRLDCANFPFGNRNAISFSFVRVEGIVDNALDDGCFPTEPFPTIKILISSNGFFESCASENKINNSLWLINLFQNFWGGLGGDYHEGKGIATT
jgi:hypothetical protein